MEKYLKYILACVLIVLLGITINNMTLYADDFYYKTFFDEGISSFIQNNVDHYNKVNGRIIVHLIDEVLLNVNVNLYYLFTLLCLFTIFWYAYKLFSDNKSKIVHFLLIAFSLIFFINTDILKETLFWTTGSLNYLFPFAMDMLAFYYIDKSIREGKISAKSIILAIIGASLTEQSFLLLGSLTFFDLFHLIINEKEKFKFSYLIYFAIECIGFLPVLLSPGADKRISDSVSIFNTSLFKMIAENSATFCATLFKHSLIFVISTLVIQIRLFVANKKSVVNIIGFIMMALMCICALALRNEVLFCIVAFAYLVMILITCLKNKELKHISLLTFSILAITFAMFLLGEFKTNRTTFDMAILLVLMCSITVEQLLALMQEWKAEIVTNSFLIFGIVCAVTITQGYAKNHGIYNALAEQVKTYDTNKKIIINTNVDKKYAHVMGYENGEFIDYFYQYYGIDDEMKKDVYYYTNLDSEIYYDNKLLQYPCLIEDNSTFVPIRELTEALGGSCNWTRQNTAFQLDNFKSIVNNTTLVIEDSTNDGYCGRELSQYIKHYLGKLYIDLDKTIYLLGIDVTQDPLFRIGS